MMIIIAIFMIIKRITPDLIHIDGIISGLTTKRGVQYELSN